MVIGISKSTQLKRNKKPKKLKPLSPWKRQNSTSSNQSATDTLLESIKIDNQNKKARKQNYSAADNKRKKDPKPLTSILKKDQTEKKKSEIPRIMPRKEYREKCDWLFDQNKICQICNIRRAEQAHHAIYGSRMRDDRSIVAVCEKCHYAIHHGKDEPAKDRKEVEVIGERNHREWQKFSKNTHIV